MRDGLAAGAGVTDLRDIPVVILAGGRGARFDHESQVLPKPLIQVVGKPIIGHIIDGFVAQGFREFIVLTGYLGQLVRDHFHSSAETVSCPPIDSSRPWFWAYISSSGDDRVTVYVHETGVDSHTGLRLWRARELIGKRRFVLTYGDGLSDVSMADVIAKHDVDLREHWERHPAVRAPVVTLTAVNPPGRFGVIHFNGALHNHVRSFSEKGVDEWINGGFMVCDPSLFDHLDNGQMQLEPEVLPELAHRWLLRAHRHRGYWRCMDTRRDLEQIEEDVRQAGRLPWLPAAA